MSFFEQAFETVVGHEGGFSKDPADPGNWTGGSVGAGLLRGTNFGISAAAYPDLDIASLKLADASAIYRRDYWDRVCGEQFAAPLALLLFDSAVNCGVGRSVRWLQQALGDTADGAIGQLTLEAMKRASQQPGGGAMLCAEFLALRMVFMSNLPTWRRFGLGWTRRLCRLPFRVDRGGKLRRGHKSARRKRSKARRRRRLLPRPSRRPTPP